ncbi:hypothetical protein GTW69_05105 [Streptomyces sp. SID7760]|nr:hypothetical protein [Streptomyces sp. SID7760]
MRLFGERVRAVGDGQWGDPRSPRGAPSKRSATPSRGVGADDRLPDGLVEFALKEVMPYVDGPAAGGLFAAPPEVPAGANAQTRLLALVGRRG